MSDNQHDRGMALLKREILLLLIFVGVCGFCKCNGSVYKVGDSVGWTIMGNVDYNQWASSKTFQVGDTLVFEYDQAFHNVMQKVEIRVPSSSRPTIPGPAQAPHGTEEAPQDHPIKSVGPTPSPNGAESILPKNALFSASVRLLLLLIWAYN
ncbi:early nodulin-like protein [Striga asiatica]|uniref:Early nodulin-like protein n=1 Tax=Striga asiatica TaxID=4170 RepID=A0A5A7Q3Q5_STRAF|nr:early nodulin-like protein [Striga asiatica]